MLNLQLWGVAYLAAAHSLNWNRHPQPWIFVVLVLHKVFCTATWVWWLLYKQKPVAVPPWDADLEQIWGKDPIVALFFATYGAADFGFACIFFQAAELGFAAPPPPRKRRTTPTSKETALRTLVYLGAFPSRYDQTSPSYHADMFCEPKRKHCFTKCSLCTQCAAAWMGIDSLGRWWHSEVVLSRGAFARRGCCNRALGMSSSPCRCSSETEWLKRMIHSDGVQGLLSVAAAQSLGGAQPQPWLFAALCLSHLFYFSCWASLLFVQQGAHGMQHSGTHNSVCLLAVQYKHVNILSQRIFPRMEQA
eukprot:COSAG02_NODE_234_length_27784_cov_12.556872_10_plen_305_part_00